MARARRLRGLLLRLTLNRPLAVAAGILLASPGALLVVGDYPWETGATDGVALLILATGVALVWVGITGRRPDWYESESRIGAANQNRESESESESNSEFESGIRISNSNAKSRIRNQNRE